ncbi:hypothetical protein quinque_015923 [Culex quinquefasciatus]
MEEAIVTANWKIINMLSKADIRLRGSGLCSIRDVAYSRFDRSTSTLLAFCQLQVNYIHQLIQGHIVDSPDALAEVYKCLKYFPQSLQMDVLYTQTLRLMRDHLDDHIHVDEYIPGTKQTVSTCPNTSTVR